MVTGVVLGDLLVSAPAADYRLGETAIRRERVTVAQGLESLAGAGMPATPAIL